MTKIIHARELRPGHQIVGSDGQRYGVVNCEFSQDALITTKEVNRSARAMMLQISDKRTLYCHPAETVRVD
jgi:hypothetical protein